MRLKHPAFGGVGVGYLLQYHGGPEASMSVSISNIHSILTAPLPEEDALLPPMGDMLPFDMYLRFNDHLPFLGGFPVLQYSRSSELRHTIK